MNQIQQVNKVTNRTILQGDVLDKLAEIPDGIVDCIISSPPYWGLRDYGVDGQIGLESDFRDYLKIMAKIMVQLKRVLKNTGTCWINLGDTYASSGGASRHFGYQDPKYGNNKGGDHIEPQTFPQGIEPKSRFGIPERFYINCIDDGWIARNHIPWYKANSMPSSIKNRFTNKWESIFFFAKSNQNNFSYNERTRQSLPNPPKIRKGGLDWEYKTCNTCNGTGKTETGKKHKRCNGNGIYRYSFWNSIDYYFNLDAVREKTITESKPFNRRVRDTKRGIEQQTLTGGMSKGEDQIYNKKGEIKEKYSDNSQSNVARLHKDRVGNPNNRYTNEKLNHRNGLGASTLDKKQDSTLGPDGKPIPTYKGFNERWNNKAQDQYTKRILEERANGAEHDNPLGNPNGKNPGDVFFINPKPFAEAHFATFPVDLPLKILKCACPQQVCSKCGIPRYPITKSNSNNENFNEEWDKTKKQIYGNDDDTTRRSRVRASLSNGSVYNTSIITSYSKCSCNEPFKPGIVLDPFFGAGTVGVAAEQLGLHWIGIELKKEYITIANKRLEQFKHEKLEVFL